MSENQLISVLIPAYNHEKYIQETIKSVICQTYQNIELIIVDDGSPDKTYEKINEIKEECEKRFTRVHFETKKNEGTCKTLNRLLELSCGEYIFLTASDDKLKPELIEREAEFLSQNQDYALVVFDNEIIDAESKTCYWDENLKNTYNIKEAKYNTFGHYLEHVKGFKFESERFGRYKELYEGNHIPNGFLIRKSVFEKIGPFTTEAPLEDYWLMLQISKYAKMKFFDEPMFCYRWHGNNTITQGSKMAEYGKKTIEHENQTLMKLDSSDRDILQNVFDWRYSFLLSAQDKKIKDIEDTLYLTINKKQITEKYYLYKILSKITFGSKRKKYKENAKLLHEKLRNLRKKIYDIRKSYYL